MLFTLISRILGIVRVSLLSSIFGASAAADVINFTFNIPNNLRKMLAEGALSSAFIPVLSKTLSEDEGSSGPRAENLVSQLLYIQFFLFVGLTALVWTFSEPIIVFLSDFEDVSKIESSARMLRYFMIYLLFISQTAVLQAALNCKDSFLIPAAAPLCFSVSVITSLILFGRTYGTAAFTFGVVIGGILQFLVVLPSFFKRGYTFSNRLSEDKSDISSVGRHWLPVLLTSGIAIVSQQAAYFFASAMEEGSITSFTNAIIFWQLPYGLFFNSTVTVYFPKMSRSFHDGDHQSLREDLSSGLKRILIFLIPSTVILMILSEEFTAAILFRGAYTLEDTLVTAACVKMFALGLICIAVYNYLVRFCYAVDRFKQTVISSVIVLLIDIGFSIYAVTSNLDVSYLALANTLAFAVGTVYLLLMLQHEYTSLLQSSILKCMVRIVLLQIPAVIILLLFMHLIPELWWTDVQFIPRFFLTALLAAVFGGLVLAAYRIAHVPVFSS